MSRVYLDTNFLFGLLRQEEKGPTMDEAFAAWRQRVESEMAGDRPVISSLVVDELAYRLVLSWVGDSGVKDPLGEFRADSSAVMRRMRPKLQSLWTSLAKLEPHIAPTDEEDMVLAQDLMMAPGLAPRDAFHAAYAIRGACSWIVTSDSAFDQLDRVARLGP